MYTLKVLVVVAALACSVARQFPDEDENGSPIEQRPRGRGTIKLQRIERPIIKSKYRRNGMLKTQNEHRIINNGKIEDSSHKPITTSLPTRIPSMLRKMLKEGSLLPRYCAEDNYLRAVKSSTTPDTYLDTVSASPTQDGMENSTSNGERSSASRLPSFFGFSITRYILQVLKSIILSLFTKEEEAEGLVLQPLDAGTSEDHNEVMDNIDLIPSWIFLNHFMDDDVKEVVLQSFFDESEEKEPKDGETPWEKPEEGTAEVVPNAGLTNVDGDAFATKPNEDRFDEYDRADYDNVTELLILEEATVDGLDFARAVRQGDPKSNGLVSDDIGPLRAALTLKIVRPPRPLASGNQRWRQIMKDSSNSSPIQESSTEKMQGTAHTGNNRGSNNNYDSLYSLPLLIAVCVALTVAIVGFVFGWSALNRKAQAAAEVDYPAYGVTGPSVVSTADRRLAHSAQIYHYQHQKQQIIAMDKNGIETRPGSVSDPESEDDNDDGDYTVYECPGLATTGDMEVKNPMFKDEPTPGNSGVARPKTKE